MLQYYLRGVLEGMELDKNGTTFDLLIAKAVVIRVFDSLLLALKSDLACDI
jgi:hypothetical protein